MLSGDNRKGISIINVILIVFVALIIITVTVIGLVIFNNWRNSTGDIVRKIADDTNTGIFNKIAEIMQTPTRINEANRKLIDNSILDYNDDKEREKFFVGILQSQSSEIYSISYGTEKGEYYGARRNEKGVVEIMKNNEVTGGQSWYYSVKNDLTAGKLVLKAGKFDPRTRDWYKAAKETSMPVYSPIYKHFVMPDLAISAACPVYGKNGELQGVLGTHIILSSINNLLADITRERNGYALIVEKSSGALVANSFGTANFSESADGKIHRTLMTEIGNKALANAYNRYLTTHEDTFIQKTSKDELYMDFTEYTQNGIDWVVVAAVPKSLLISNINHSMQNTMFLVLVLVLLSILIYFLIAGWLVKPVDNLIKTSEKISGGDLSQRVAIARNDELGRISRSFNKMADKISELVNGLEASVKERTAELESANEALKESKGQLRLILDSTAEAIYSIDNEGRCTMCNASSLEILGYKNQEELLGKNTHLLIHHSTRDGLKIPFEECAVIKTLYTGKKAYKNDEVFWRADGTCFDVEYYSYPQYRDGELVGAVVTFMDITERKKDEEQIRYLSSHDSLTGLYNRSCFEAYLKKYDVRENLPLSIIFADVNGLKLTNDIFGHSSGDILIRKSAEILKKACREGDIVARVGGDEFIILLPRTEAADVKKIIDRVKNDLSKEKVEAVKCSMALGHDTKTQEYQNIERTMINAENRMYKEKSLNREANNNDMIRTIINTLHNRNYREKSHSINVSDLCEKTAKLLELPETKVKKIRDAGYIHDIGKIVFEKGILDDDSEMTEERSKEMKQHPIIGYRILNLFDETLDLAEAIYSHHENWDGTGYPKGIKGEEIPITSRIIALAEYYDRKMSEARKDGYLKKREAIQYIGDNAGKLFDPQLAGVFIKMVEGIQ